MAHPKLHPAKLLRKEDAGGNLMRIALEPGASVRATYRVPGQYVVLKADGKVAYFVLAGDPGAAEWELVVRPAGEAAAAALAVDAGAHLEVSDAQGAGFPMEEARGQELIVAVTGSGVAAARPVVRDRIEQGAGKETELLLGVRTLGDVPLASELESWSRAGVRVTVCLSQEGIPASGRGLGPSASAHYSSGYVQDVARRHARAAPTRKRLLFAAGVKAMIEAMRTLAKDLGVHEADVRTNY